MDTYQENLLKVEAFLKDNKRGATVSEISRQLSLSRNSVAKYLDVLLISGRVELERFGPSKVYYLSDSIPVSELLNLTSDKILILNAENKIIQVNQPVLDFLNLKREDLVKTDVFKTPFLGPHEERAQKNVEEAFAGKFSSLELQGNFGGQEKVFELKFYPTILAIGDKGIVIVIVDKTANFELKERKKELNCIVAVLRLIKENNKTNDVQTFLKKVVSLIPPSMLYPELTWVHIEYDGAEVSTENYRESKWKITETISVADKTVGTLSVGYLKETPEYDKGPFLQEEYVLVEAIAIEVGLFLSARSQ